MLTLSKVEKGRLAEALVRKFLNERSLRIIEKNLRKGRAEIDIIFMDGQYLVFSEVKYREKSEYGYSESMLSQAQEERIRMLADEYLNHNPWPGRIRFDIFALSGPIGNPVIDHFKDAF